MPIKVTTDYTPEMLKYAIERLEKAAGSLRATHHYAQSVELDSLPITNHKEFVVGLEKVARFVMAAEQAMQNHVLGSDEE